MYSSLTFDLYIGPVWIFHFWPTLPRIRRCLCPSLRSDDSGKSLYAVSVPDQHESENSGPPAGIPTRVQRPPSKTTPQTKVIHPESRSFHSLPLRTGPGAPGAKPEPVTQFEVAAPNRERRQSAVP